MFNLLLLPLVPLVAGHGGMLWPPSWLDGVGLPIWKINDYKVWSDPVVQDPESGRRVRSIKSWLTDQAYLGGHGDQYEGVGNVTNPECKKQTFCVRKLPWASPGTAPSLGGGCGIFGGNPYGCTAGNDTREKGSTCGQFKQQRGTFAFGSSALDMEFPQALTTKWSPGSKQNVAWVGKGGHWGGYTYRLCKIPPQGKTGITEECFAQNVLKFATSYTAMRDIRGGKWTWVKQDDLTEGTFHQGVLGVTWLTRQPRETGYYARTRLLFQVTFQRVTMSSALGGTPVPLRSGCPVVILRLLGTPMFRVNNGRP